MHTTRWNMSQLYILKAGNAVLFNTSVTAIIYHVFWLLLANTSHNINHESQHVCNIGSDRSGHTIYRRFPHFMRKFQWRSFEAGHSQVVHKILHGSKITKWIKHSTKHTWSNVCVSLPIHKLWFFLCAHRYPAKGLCR